MENNKDTHVAVPIKWLREKYENAFGRNMQIYKDMAQHEAINPASLTERIKTLEEALKWYADSGNYLADFDYLQYPFDKDQLLATAMAGKRIELKAKQALLKNE